MAVDQASVAGGRRGVSNLPFQNLAVANLHDTNALTNGVTRGVHVGVAGDLKVVTAGGQTVVISKAVVGWHWISVTQIFSTGTTATDITVGW